jgi:hypothetical protein
MHKNFRTTVNLGLRFHEFSHNWQTPGHSHCHIYIVVVILSQSEDVPER